MLSGAVGLLKLSQINNTMDMSKVGGAFPGVDGSNERKFNVKTWEISTISKISTKKHDITKSRMIFNLPWHKNVKETTKRIYPCILIFHSSFHTDTLRCDKEEIQKFT